VDLQKIKKKCQLGLYVQVNAYKTLGLHPSYSVGVCGWTISMKKGSDKGIDDGSS